MASEQVSLAALAAGELRDLLRILRDSDVEELELQIAGTRLHFKRPATAIAPDSVVAEDESPSASEDPVVDLVAAERVGFFHYPDGGNAPPGAGDTVAAGQVLGSIDSLSVPVPVQAPRAGLLEEVLVDEGQPVEYGQPLFAIRFDAS